MSLSGLSTRGHLTRRSYKNTPDDAWVIEKRTSHEPLGPELPSLEGVVWHRMTRAWYRDIRKSDIAQTYTAVQWQSLLDAALLKNAIVSGIGRNGRPLGHRDFQGYQTELRQKESALLLLPESLKRNKVVFVDPEPADSGLVVRSSIDYRKMFSDLEVSHA